MDADRAKRASKVGAAVLSAAWDMAISVGWCDGMNASFRAEAKLFLGMFCK